MILVAFGANLPSSIGSPRETYEELPQLLNMCGIRVLSASSLHVTAPVPVSDQPDYCNAVLAVETDLGAEECLLALHRVESDLGRVRDVRNEARGIDLDLIAYHDEIMDEDGLSVPHPRMHERLFVLEPLAEIAPNWVHPRFKKSVNDLILALK